MTDNREQPDNKKIETLYVIEEMASDAKMDQEIRNGLIRDTGKTEEQIRNQTNQSGPSREMKEKMYANIVQNLKEKGLWEEEKMETEKEEPEENNEDVVSRLSSSDREALEVGRKILSQPQTPRWKKLIKGVVGAAVVMLGVFAVGMSSEANRLRILSVWNSIVGEEMRINMDNEQDRMEDILEEQAAYNEIEDKLGIRTLEFLYKPEKMEFDDFIVSTENNSAYVFYKYQNSIVTVYMYKQSNRMTRNRAFEGKIVTSVRTNIKDLKIDIGEIENLDGRNAFEAGFTYNNVYYSIWGELPQEEFEKMISEIYL